MPSPLFLPAAEDTQISIHIGSKEPFVADIFDLEDSFVLAQTKAEDMGTVWKNEYPTIFKNKFKKDITAGQALLLWQGVRVRLEELKKSLLDESASSEKPVSQSPRTRKQK